MATTEYIQTFKKELENNTVMVEGNQDFNTENFDRSKMFGQLQKLFSRELISEDVVRSNTSRGLEVLRKVLHDEELRITTDEGLLVALLAGVAYSSAIKLIQQNGRKHNLYP